MRSKKSCLTIQKKGAKQLTDNHHVLYHACTVLYCSEILRNLPGQKSTDQLDNCHYFFLDCQAPVFGRVDPVYTFKMYKPPYKDLTMTLAHFVCLSTP